MTPATSSIGRHGGVGIGHAQLLRLAEGVVKVGLRDGLDVTDCERIPTDMGAEKRGVEMDDFAGRDPGGDACLDRAFKVSAEALGTPVLANARQ